MITLKNYVAAFLQNGNNYLLMKRADNDNAVYVCVADNDNGELKMNWARCEDFEK